MPNQHKLILSNDELLNSNLRDELILNLKKEGFQSRKIFFYKKGIKEELNNDNHQESLFSEKEIVDLRLQEKSILNHRLNIDKKFKKLNTFSSLEITRIYKNNF